MVPRVNSLQSFCCDGQWSRNGGASVRFLEQLRHRPHATAASRPSAACAPYLPNCARSGANFLTNSVIINALTMANEHGSRRRA
jgi:hypothetical protein